jgi:hypothetical protein
MRWNWPVDQLVHELHGLTDNEIRAIEEAPKFEDRAVLPNGER